MAPVGRRDEVARAAGCTHLVSLHLNAGGGTGTETYYRDARDEAFARSVHDGVVDALDLADRGLRPESGTRIGRLAVLDFGGPACLVELGFVDRASDREKLLRRSSRLLVAEAIWSTFTIITSLRSSG